MSSPRTPRDPKKLTPNQIAALRAIAATGDAGLPEKVGGKVSIHGNCEAALRGWGYRNQHPAAIESRDHGFLRTVYMRGGGSYELRDLRWHLTDEGRRLVAALPSTTLTT